jgi:hypothetical protein
VFKNLYDGVTTVFKTIISDFVQDSTLLKVFYSGNWFCFFLQVTKTWKESYSLGPFGRGTPPFLAAWFESSCPEWPSRIGLL